MIIIKAVVEEVSFGTITSWEEAKPILWGMIIPLILTVIWENIFSMVIVPAIVVLVQVSKGEKEKAAATLGWALLIPATAVGIIIVSLFLSVL